MDNRPEDFERNSRLEFLHSPGISKGELGRLTPQWYRCLDDTYLTKEEVPELYLGTDILSKKMASFIIYLNSTPYKGLTFKDRLKS